MFSFLFLSCIYDRPERLSHIALVILGRKRPHTHRKKVAQLNIALCVRFCGFMVYVYIAWIEISLCEWKYFFEYITTSSSYLLYPPSPALILQLPFSCLISLCLPHKNNEKRVLFFLLENRIHCFVNISILALVKRTQHTATRGISRMNESRTLATVTPFSVYIRISRRCLFEWFDIRLR